MLEFAHALTGGVIAYKIGNPLVSLPISFLSHFIVDLLPHWNPSLSKEKKKFGHIKKRTLELIVLDSLFGLFLGLSLASKKLPDTKAAIFVLLGCFLGVLPDLLEAPYYFSHQPVFKPKCLMKFQGKHQFNIPLVPGLISQILFTIFLLYLVA